MNINYRAQEDPSSEGGGVYKVGTINGDGKIQLKQADYPGIDLGSLTVNNFFKSTYVNAGGAPYVRSSTKYSYTGRKLDANGTSTGMSYDSNTYTITVSGGTRTIRGGMWVPQNWGPEYCYSTNSAVHTIYMTKFPMI